MKRYLAGFLALSSIYIPWIQPASAETAIHVVIDQQLATFEQAPLIFHDVTMIPMREIFTILDAEVQWNEVMKTITAKKEEVTIQLKVGSTYALRNNQQISLDVPAFIKNGRTYVPLRFISEALGAEVSWDQPAKTVRITSSELKKEREAIPTLTVEQAVDWAQANSNDLKMAQQDIERSDISLENASDDLEYTPIGTGNGQDDAAIRSAWKKYSSSQINYQMSKQEMEVAKDQVAYRVKEAYQAILLKENDLKSSEESLELAKMKEQAAIVKAQIGKISNVEKNDVVKARIEAEQNHKIAKATLQDAWTKLNIIMGKPLGSSYKLVDKPKYTELETMDIETYITRMVSSSPSIWLLDKQIELAELDVNLFTFNAGGSYELEKMDIDKAQLTLASSKNQLEEAIRNFYSNLTQLETQYHVLETNLQKAEDNLRVAQAKMAKGLTTTLDLTEQQLNVNQKKRDMEKIAIQMDQVQFKLHKPWVN